MKKPTKRDTINLFFSAFLIIAFILHTPYQNNKSAVTICQPNIRTVKFKSIIFAIYKKYPHKPCRYSSI